MFNYEQWDRKMENYSQHLPMNCGGIAAVFTVYGFRQSIPDSAIPMLLSQRLAGPSICDFVRSASRGAMKPKFVPYGGLVQVGGVRPVSVKVEFLEQLSDCAEGIVDILDTNHLRCLIMTCDTDVGPHWQTFFAWPSARGPARSRLRVYNARPNWAPLLAPVLSTPTAAILVTGHAIA